MVAATVPASAGTLKRRLAARRARLGVRVASMAGAAGTALRVTLALVLAVRGVAGVALVSYGAWLAYEPAGFVVAGLLVLADRVLDERSRSEEREA